MRPVPLSEYEVLPLVDFAGRYSLIRQPWYIDQSGVKEEDKLGRLRLNFPERKHTRSVWFDPDEFLILFYFEDPRYILVGPTPPQRIRGFFEEVDTTPKRSNNGFIVKPWVPNDKNLFQVSVPVGTKTVAASKIGDRRFISTLVKGSPSMGVFFTLNPTNLWLPIPRFPVQPDLSKLGDTLL